MSERPDPPPSQQARIELLGPPRLVVEGRREPLRPGKKPLALLAYLVAHPGEQISREKLAALLWPDRFEEQARASLRQALTALRKTLGAHGEAILASGDGQVALDPAAIDSDLAELDRLHQADDLASLEAAAALYRGDFLDQLGGVSDDFDAWAASERERLRAQATGALSRLVDRLSAAGKLDDARSSAERLVAVDPAHEPGHRALMTILAAQGQRAAALRQYEACRRALAEHLDAEPDAETAALAQAIRNAAAPSAVPTPPPPLQTASAAPAPPRARLIRRPSWLRALRRRRLAIGAALAAGAALLLWVAAPPRGRPPTAVEASAAEARAACLAGAGAGFEEPALVVLPLRTFGGDESHALLAAAATERVQSVLSLIPGLAVIAGPPEGHPDLALGARELARRHGATHALDGSVRARAGQLELTARLIDARTGRQLWQATERLALPLADPVGAQDAVAIAAVEAVQERLTDGRQALAYPRYESATLPVWEANTRGWAYLAKLEPAAAIRARAAFQSSLALEPQNAGANAGLALSYVTPLILSWTGDARASLAIARERADAALAIDPAYAPAASIRSLVALLEGDHARAVELGEEALRLSGGGADAAALLAYVLSYTDDTARSVELARRAARARPYASPLWYALILGRAQRLDGDVAGAVGCLSAAVAAHPGVIAPALEAIQAYDAGGETEAVQPLVDLVLEQAPEGFTSAAYCATPPYTSEERTAACVAALQRAGLP